MAAALLLRGVAIAQEPGSVELDLQPSSVFADPGEMVPFVVRATGEPGVTLTPELVLPQGFRLVVDVGALPLGGGGEGSAAVLVLVEDWVLAGEYDVLVLDGAAHNDGRAQLVVAPVLEVRPEVAVDTAAATSGDEVTFTWSVRNGGNTPRRLEIDLLPRNLETPIPARQVAELGPREVVTGTLRARIGSDSTSAAVALEVRDTERKDLLEHATAAVRVLPRSGRVDRFRRLTTEAALWNLTGTADEGRLRTAFQGEAGARGVLDVEEHWRLDLRVRTPTVQTVYSRERFDEYSLGVGATYSRWSAGVRLGDASHRLTELTEQGGWQRGATAWGSVGPVDGMFRIARDRFSEAEPWRLGGSIGWKPVQRARLALNVIWNRAPVRNDWALTHSGAFELLREAARHDLSLDYEVGYGGGSPAVFLGLGGRGPTTQYWMRGVWAGPSYPGSWRDRISTSVGVQQALGRFLFVPTLQYEQKGRFDSPSNRFLQANFATSAKVSRSTSLSMAYYHYETWSQAVQGLLFSREDAGLGTVGWRGRTLGLMASAGARVSAQSEVGGAVPAAFGGASLDVRDLRQFGGRVSVQVDSNQGRSPDSGWNVVPAMSVGWFGAKAQHAVVGYEMTWSEDHKDQLWHWLWTTGSVELPWKHLIQWRVRTRLVTGARDGMPNTIESTIGYVARFGIPLGLRDDLGRISGTVLRDGVPAADVPVLLDGHETRTDASGAYAFDTELGQGHLLRVPVLDLGASDVVLPRSQMELRFPESDGYQELTQDFSLIEGASLRARLIRYESPTHYVYSGEPEFFPAGAISGATVTITNGTTARRALSDADGWVTFDRLPPGEWTVMVDAPDLPEGVAVERPKRTLDLRGDEEIEVRALPRVERIRFVDEPEPIAPVPDEVVVEEFRVTPDSVVVGPNGEVEVLAQLVFSNGRVENVAGEAMWTSSNLDVATAGKGFVIGVAPGTALVEVQFRDRPPVTLRVEVVELPFVALSVEPAEIALVPGASTRLGARSIDTNGRFKDVTRDVEWVSQDPEIAVVGPDGAVLAKKEGTTKIVARLFGITAFPVTVTVAANAYAPLREVLKPEPEPMTPEPAAEPEPTPEPAAEPEPTPEPAAEPEPTPEPTEEPSPAPEPAPAPASEQAEPAPAEPAPE